MALQSEEQVFIKQYLLGELTQEAQQPVEERLLTDNLFFEELSIAEDELIDQYLCDSLTEHQKQRFEEHFLATSERRRKLTFARALRKYVSTSEASEAQAASKQKRRFLTWPPFFFSSYARAAVAAMVLLVVALGVWQVFFRQSEIDKGLFALQTAYKQQRPVEARISGFSYAPLITLRGNADGKIDSKSRERAELILRNAEHENPGPAASHALGKLYLSQQKFDQAISEFEKALKSDANDPQIQSDLGAAWLEKGKSDSAHDEGKSFEYFAQGLEHINKALELNGSLLEALFNRALSYQYLLLPQQAEDAWRKYLEKDPHSQWAVEANRNLQSLEERKNKSAVNQEQLLQDFLRAYQNRDDNGAWQIISQNRNLSGNSVENGLLDAYLELISTGQAQLAKEKFDVLSYVGELEVQRAGDYFMHNLLRFYSSVPSAQYATLAEARSFMKQGHENLWNFKIEEAIEHYSKAKRMFENAGDTCEAEYIEYPIAHCYLQQLKAQNSLASFEKVARISEENRYKWLLAQSLNAIATAQITLNNYSIALDYSQRSISISEQIDDIGGVIKTKAQLAQEYLALGNYHKALIFNQQSLSLALEHSREPMQLWRSYYTIAMPLNLLGLSAAAVEFQKEALRLAIGMNTPQTICRSYVNLGLIYSNMRNYDEAIRNIQSAFELGKSISSPKVRVETLAYSALQLGNVYRQVGAFSQAAANYELAIQTYNKSDYPAFNYVLHKGKLLSCMAGGECSSIEQEIETSLSLFEQYRSKILEESNRDSFFDTEQNVCDVAVDYAYSKGDSGKAFNYAERCRARSLLDLTGMDVQLSESNPEKDLLYNSVAQPVNLTQLQERMPERAQILYYAVIDDKLIIWRISKRNFQSFERPINSKELTEKVLNYLQYVTKPAASDDEEMMQKSKELYDLLIKPAEALLDRDKQLIVIPDKILNHLPYAALVSSTTGKYLAEEYALTFSPSSSIFIICSDAAKKREGNKPEKLLIVGNPHFDRKTYPALEQLPQASREAEKVAAYYSSPRSLIGDKATKRIVMSEMESADVVHLAMHFVADEQSPLRSELLFASDIKGDKPQDEATGIMQAYEIYRMKLPLTRLVVLSACQTGIERYYNGEGMIGVSRPFIARGVPLVVASLWPVDSDATAELMINFHKHRKTENCSTAEALRRAQQDMINHAMMSNRHPFYWAAFITIGGYAEF